jgi:hypothetical protein
MESSLCTSSTKLFDTILVFNNSSTETTSTSMDTMSPNTTDAPFSFGETRVPLYTCFCKHYQGRVRHKLDLVMLHLSIQYGTMENDPSEVDPPSRTMASNTFAHEAPQSSVHMEEDEVRPLFLV